METRPGFSSGNQEKSTAVSVNSDGLGPPGTVGALPDTTGEKTTSTTEEISPP